MCFHPDTYSFTDRRIRWSAVFDHAVVFHPGYRERFARAGHPGAFLLPHAVRRAFFEGAERAREFDVGWVGQTCWTVVQNPSRMGAETRRRISHE